MTSVEKADLDDVAEEEQLRVFMELEGEYQASKTKLTDRELLETFPQAIKILPIKIKEWQTVINTLKTEVQNRLNETRKTSQNKNDYWFVREWLKITLGQELLKAERHIARLKNLIWISRHPKSQIVKGRITSEQITLAKQRSIAELYSGKLRRSGKNLFGLCPFHSERHGSFCININSNRWHCFGACGTGGDSINYIMKFHGLDFIEAVKFLTGE